MTLTITIPDDVAPQIMDNICAATNYDAGSSKDKTTWAKDQMIRTLKQMATQGAVKNAVATTKATLEAASIS